MGKEKSWQNPKTCFRIENLTILHPKFSFIIPEKKHFLKISKFKWFLVFFSLILIWIDHAVRPTKFASSTFAKYFIFLQLSGYKSYLALFFATAVMQFFLDWVNFLTQSTTVWQIFPWRPSQKKNHSRTGPTPTIVVTKTYVSGKSVNQFPVFLLKDI